MSGFDKDHQEILRRRIKRQRLLNQTNANTSLQPQPLPPCSQCAVLSSNHAELSPGVGPGLVVQASGPCPEHDNVNPNATSSIPSTNEQTGISANVSTRPPAHVTVSSDSTTHVVPSHVSIQSASTSPSSMDSSQPLSQTCSNELTQDPIDIPQSSSGSTSAISDTSDDMFAEASADVASTSAESGSDHSSDHNSSKELIAQRADNYDDSEGYYRVIPGEIIGNGQYRVVSSLGKGVFSIVVRAEQQQADQPLKCKLVAIKIIRNNDQMRKAGLQEIKFLEKAHDATNVIRLLTWFDHRCHLCLVFDNLKHNLRDLLRTATFTIHQVQSFTKQIVEGLCALQDHRIIHSDLKPDNILVDSNNTTIKIADLGSAMWYGEEHPVAPYMASRFYRAPELILGFQYDYSIDVWSVACTLYELYTRQILFAGTSNNDMLQEIMKVRGPFAHKMIKGSQFGYKYFNCNFEFLGQDIDAVSGNSVIRIITNLNPVETLKAKFRFLGRAAADIQLSDSLYDLLDKMLILDPRKRLTCSKALKHMFCTHVEPAMENSTSGGTLLTNTAN